MGSYTTLSIDGYQVLSSKTYVDPVVMTAFTEADKSIREIREPDTDGSAFAGGDPTQEHTSTEVGYNASGSIIRDRLEVMGFTLRATRTVFETGIRSQILETLKSERSLRNSKAFPDQEAIASLYDERIRMLHFISFDSWLDTFRCLKHKDLNRWDLTLKKNEPAIRDLLPLERFMLSEDQSWDELPFRFPPCDVRFLIRAAVEACGANATVKLDLSDVVSSGWYGIGDQVAENARLELTADYPLNTKVIVLTEGVTDRRVLESSLRLLYPHLSDYFSFMDFEGANAQGGAGQLVNTVKAFAGAGIANRIVALFDNDTGARAALRGLDAVVLPPSMRVLQFPPITLASDFPTRGPSGLVNMDVNGLAGSLEMYLGEDVLRRTDSTFIPVHWRGFDAAVHAYQGEIEAKGQVHDRFNQKLSAALANPVLIQSQDWSGIRAILDMVRHAFENDVAY
jgi:hypothetical protein